MHRETTADGDNESCNSLCSAHLRGPAAASAGAGALPAPRALQSLQLQPVCLPPPWLHAHSLLVPFLQAGALTPLRQQDACLRLQALCCLAQMVRLLAAGARVVLKGHQWGLLQHAQEPCFWAGPASVGQLGPAAPPQPAHSAAQGQRLCPAGAVSVAGQAAETRWLPVARQAVPAAARPGPHLVRCLDAVHPWQLLLPWTPLHRQVPRCEGCLHHYCPQAAPCLQLCDADCARLQAHHWAARVQCQAPACFVAPLRTGCCCRPAEQPTPLQGDRPLPSRAQHQEQHLGC